MRRIRISGDARADLDEIWRYIARSSSPETAQRFINRITDTFSSIAWSPKIGRLRKDLHSGVRSFPVGRYVIYYRQSNGDVVILRVFHGVRDVAAMLEQ